MLQEHWDRLDYVAHEVIKIPGVSTAYYYNPKQIANHIVGMEISWDPRGILLNSREALEEFLKGKPGIVMGGGRGGKKRSSPGEWLRYFAYT